ncbi:MAG: ABC transporter permease [Defluviitaleaceae bacterium]|nr:ABC transporter permease [Defluviitaleaceae bacterium]
MWLTNLKKTNINLKIGCTIIGLLLAIMILSLFWTPHDPMYIPLVPGQRMLPPSLLFPLGTDHLGRCILSRAMVASQTAFMIGFLTLLVAGALGITIGLVSGFFGGITDEILMRVVDILLAIPNLLVLLMFISVFGGGTLQTVLALSFVNFVTFTKVVRNRVVSIKEKDHILWAKNIGAKKHRIMFSHILAELAPILLVVGAMMFSGAVMAEAVLSYLGLGVQQPYPSWGNMLTRAQMSLTTNIFYAAVPGTLITLLVIGANLISDGIKNTLGVGNFSQ